METQNNYEIISLGGNCQVRTYLTTRGVLKTKAHGRLSMPFDLSSNPTIAVAQILENACSDYLDGLEYKFVNGPRRMVWQQPKYNSILIHDTDCGEFDREKITERYRHRFENLQNAIIANDFIFFIHNAQGTSDDINYLYSVLEKICQNAEKERKKERASN